MTRKKRENAFVIDWVQFNWASRTTNVLNTRYNTYGGDPKPKKRKENGGKRDGGDNVCYFLLNENGERIEWAKRYRYYTKTAYQAKALNRLMQIVQEYQRYYQIQSELREEMGDERGRYWSWDQTPCQHAMERAEELRDAWIKAESTETQECCPREWSNPELHKNIGFNVSELDVSKKQEIKPCFFCKQYKIVDEKGHPFWVVVMLEKGDAEKNREGKDLWFNYHIKFIGSAQPLTKFVARVPLCYDAEKERYQQKIEEYRTANKDYYNQWRSEICKEFVENREKFADKFKTKNVEVEKNWIKCDHVVQTGSCTDYYYTQYRYCYSNRCPFYRGWDVKTMEHEGELAKKFFANAFGDAVTKLVSAGSFTYADKDLLPDISDVNFIKAFNHFCWYASSRYRKRWGMYFSKDNKVDFWNYYINYYDYADDFTKAEKNLQDAIKTIEAWANNPNMFSFVHKDKPYTVRIAKKAAAPAKEADEEVDEEQKEPISEEEKLRTLKEHFLNKRLSMVKNPAILVESPGKTTSILRAWNDYDYHQNWEEEEWWITDCFVNVEHKKSDGRQGEITYNFKCADETHFYPIAEDMSRSLEAIMCILGALQTRTKLKWTPSKLFEKEQGNDDVIKVLRVNENYNGVTILDPNNIKEPITCNHYEVRKVDMYGWQSQPTVILLYAGMNKVSGVIYCDKPEEITSRIISHSKIRQMLADRKAYTVLKQYNTVKKQVQKWVAQSAEDDMPF